LGAYEKRSVALSLAAALLTISRRKSVTSLWVGIEGGLVTSGDDDGDGRVNAEEIHSRPVADRLLGGVDHVGRRR